MTMRLLDAEFDVLGPDGVRSVSAHELFVGFFTTILSPVEIVTRIRLAKPAGEWGWGFAEFARKTGDFALVAAAAIVEARDGVVRRARVALAGAAGTPLRASDAETLLVGRALDDDGALAAAAEAAGEACSPPADAHASSGFRRRLVVVGTRRALRQATAGASALR